MAQNPSNQPDLDDDDRDFIPCTQVSVDINLQDDQLAATSKRQLDTISGTNQDFNFVAPLPRPAKQPKVQTTTHQPQYNVDQMFEHSQQLVTEDSDEQSAVTVESEAESEAESVASDLHQSLSVASGMISKQETQMHCKMFTGHSFSNQKYLY